MVLVSRTRVDRVVRDERGQQHEQEVVMATYTLDVSDDYVTEIEADTDTDAMNMADKVAEQHGSLIEVLVYKGSILSGGSPIYTARTDARGKVRA